MTDSKPKPNSNHVTGSYRPQPIASPFQKKLGIEDVEEISPREDRQLGYVISSWVGIAIAGSLYSLVLMAIMVLFAVLQGGFRAGDVAGVLGMMFYFGLISLVVGFITSGVTGLAAVLLVSAANTSMGNPMPKRISALTAGSLAGYIPTAWVF